MNKLVAILIFFPLVAVAQESTCFGTTSDGRLESGVKLPSSGSNFESYSLIAEMAGRTYVHSQVRDILLEAYNELEETQQGKVFKFAETGFKKGGQFKPHKTHRNGLSVDFMVPVLSKEGESVHLPTNPLNKFGYNIEFNENGWYKNYTIDYEALAAHLVALHKSAKAKGFNIWRVIFAPEYQSNLLATKYGPYIKENISLSNKGSWVRHDEHYHVDFEIPCK